MKTSPFLLVIFYLAVAVCLWPLYVHATQVVGWVQATFKLDRSFHLPNAAVATHALQAALILWATMGSVFALLLGYSRIPYAAALDGYFFKAFARLHPRHRFPQLSVLVLGGISIGCSFLPLGTVIDA